MNADELRALDIEIAKALGWHVTKGVLRSPTGTFYGGDYRVDSGAMPETPEIVEQCWQDYTPRFTKHVDDALTLVEGLPLSLESAPDSAPELYGGHRWRASISWQTRVKGRSADTPALAICLMWLDWHKYALTDEGRAAELAWKCDDVS